MKWQRMRMYMFNVISIQIDKSSLLSNICIGNSTLIIHHLFLIKPTLTLSVPCFRTIVDLKYADLLYRDVSG